MDTSGLTSKSAIFGEVDVRVFAAILALGTLLFAHETWATESNRLDLSGLTTKQRAAERVRFFKMEYRRWGPDCVSANVGHQRAGEYFLHVANLALVRYEPADLASPECRLDVAAKR